MNEPARTRVYQSYPLAGSPVGRLHDDTARMLASGLLPRCPHPDQPALWYLPARMITCVACADEFMGDLGTASVCAVCGEPASSVAAWVTGGIPCIAALCEPCQKGGMVPLASN